MNMVDKGSELLKWKSVDKSISELPNNSPVYLNPGFEEIGFGIKSKKYPSSTKQSPLELLVETCKNIGHSLGLDEPLPNRKRTLLDNREEEISVSSRKKQNLSPVSYQSKSPSRVSVSEDRKHLKPIINIPVRTTPDTSGSPKSSVENINKFDKLSNFFQTSSSLSDNSINSYPDITSNSLSHHKNFNLESFVNFQSLSPNPPDPKHRLSCDCFLCLLFSIKPLLLLDQIPFPIQSKVNGFPSQNFEMKSDLLFGSLTNGSNERQSPLGIEYCMYCGLHCLSIQMLLQHIHHCHLG